MILSLFIIGAVVTILVLWSRLSQARFRIAQLEDELDRRDYGFAYDLAATMPMPPVRIRGEVEP